MKMGAEPYEESLVVLEVATGKKLYGGQNQRFRAASRDGHFIALQGGQATEVRDVTTGRLLLTVERLERPRILPSAARLYFRRPFAPAPGDCRAKQPWRDHRCDVLLGAAFCL